MAIVVLVILVRGVQMTAAYDPRKPDVMLWGSGAHFEWIRLVGTAGG